MVTGIAFLLSTLFAPLVALVPYEAAAPALVLVGFLMMTQIAGVDLEERRYRDPRVPHDRDHAVHVLDLDGIGAGFIAFVIVKLARGKVREIHWLMWLVSLLFVVYFLVDPIQVWLGL